MFRAIISPILRSTGLWYNAPDDPACIIPQPAGSIAGALHYSLVHLRMGEIIDRNMLSWLKLLINCYWSIYLVLYIILCGPGSSVGIATELRAGRSGIESRWRRDFPPVQTGTGTQPASCKMGTGYFPGIKCGRGVLLTTHPFKCRDNGRVELYLYPPSGPHLACNGNTLLFTLCSNFCIGRLFSVSPTS